MASVLARLVVLVDCIGGWGCSCNHEQPLQPDAHEVIPDAAPDATPNLEPIANAGLDTSHLIGASFALDGSTSSDPDGVLVEFQWSVETRPSGSTSLPSNALANVTSFTPDKVGSYTFALVVTDDDGATDRDEVTVVVDPGTFTVNAGPDQTVVWQDTVPLTGSYVSASGPGTAKWRVVSHPGSSTATPMPATSLTPTLFAEGVGTYVVELEITGPAGIATDTLTVTVVPPPPHPIDGDIVDIEAGAYAGLFVIASINPPRIRLLAPVWPAIPLEMVIPLTVIPTAIGVSESETYVTVIRDGTKLTEVSIASLSQGGTLDLGTTILDVRHGSRTPRAYPAQAGPLLLVNFIDNTITPGGLVPGAARGRELSSAERPLYAIDLGPNAKLRRFDGYEDDTAFVREWPYPGGQYPLGDDLWLVPDSIVTSSGHVFNASEDPGVDLTHRIFLAGDQPFEVVGVRFTNFYVVTLANRITTPPQLPETQVRFYNRLTLALEHVIPLPDLVVGGVPQRTVGRALTNTGNPQSVSVIGSVGTAYALFTVPVPF